MSARRTTCHRRTMPMDGLTVAESWDRPGPPPEVRRRAQHRGLRDLVISPVGYLRAARLPVTLEPALDLAEAAIDMRDDPLETDVHVLLELGQDALERLLDDADLLSDLAGR